MVSAILSAVASFVWLHFCPTFSTTKLVVEMPVSRSSRRPARKLDAHSALCGWLAERMVNWKSALASGLG